MAREQTGQKNSGLCSNEAPEVLRFSTRKSLKMVYVGRVMVTNSLLDAPGAGEVSWSSPM